MSQLEYYRPETIEEALELLQRGIPLAGGTAITPRRREVSAVIDLQELDLDRIESQNNFVLAGAGVKLQSVVDAEGILPDALRLACRREAGRNLRNMATLAGTLMTADGRSPLLTVMLALETQVLLEPGSKTVSLVELFEQREGEAFRPLITGLKFPGPKALGYEQVARAPADRPLVCAAAAWLSENDSKQQVRVALGGFGSKPILVGQAGYSVEQPGGVEAAVEAARMAFADAGDAWASGEYRSYVAGVLVRRLLSGGVD
jgi:probable selenate reductase FAD-binding subunit